MEVVFYPNGYPIGERSNRKMICPALRDADCIEYQPNPKNVGSHSYDLYESYKVAKTVAEARALGARGIDFAFDSNWGYLSVTRLSTEPRSDECVVTDADCGLRRVRLRKPPPGSPRIKVRIKEMSEGHKGLAVCSQELAMLIAKCPALRQVKEESWAAADGPLKTVPLEIFRVLLHWAKSGALSYARRQTKAVHAALKLCGAVEAARGVKLREVKELRAQSARAKSAIAVSGKLAAKGSGAAGGPLKQRASQARRGA